MARRKKVARPTSYLYTLPFEKVFSRASRSGIPVARFIRCQATPERTATEHARQLWKDWLRQVGYADTSLPTSGKLQDATHPAEHCGVVAFGHDPASHGPHPYCPATMGRPYPQARTASFRYDPLAPLTSADNRQKITPMQQELDNARKFLRRPVRRVDFVIPERRHPGCPTWAPAARLSVFGRSPKQWNREALEKWRRIALEEMRDAAALGTHGHPVPDTPERIAEHFGRLPTGTKRIVHPPSSVNPKTLPSDPDLHAIRAKYSQPRLQPQPHTRNP